jgi:hypothetical protein
VDVWRSAWTAAGNALTRPQLWPIALAGFLARGGVVLFVVPIIVPPSLVGLATFIGPASITPTGPTAGLIVRITAGVVVVGAALLAGTIAGAAAEIALIRTGRSHDGQDDGFPRLADRRVSGLLRRVVLIRLICLLPVAIVFGIGVQRLGQIAYLELTLPTDLVTPIAIRVALRVPEVVAAIVLVWLFGETWGGIATRLAVLQAAGLAVALGGGLARLPRRIVAVVPLALVTTLVAVVVLGLAVGLIGWSWSLVRDALLGGTGIGGVLAMAGSTLLFVGCWVVGLAAAAVLATWRAVAWTLAMGEDHRGSGRTAPERGTL